ncbi:FAD dependent oxidoreductase [Novymonas esmeraldas]|uniref:L-2-hydroxyglutarate dehydrogenase, mitochondrial n=1 Tax=Novymonas esmeraldas TaxID=1808958 RepID=A0AAW0F4A2_9TRYP
MLQLDYCVVGGGIVGLAIGAALSSMGSVAVLERGPRLIQETSSRNSGVVHSGLYYPADSLKTQLCMAGNANIWRLQRRFPDLIRARRIGKWIGACDAAEASTLEDLTQKMRQRDIPYELISAAMARREEPLLQMHTIVNSTSTGIVDVHSLADFYQGVVEQSSEGYVLCDSEVTRVDLPAGYPCRADTPPIRVMVGKTGDRDGEAYTVGVRRAVVCAAGLHANVLWSRMCCDGTPLRPPPTHRLYACKGRYAGYRGAPPLSRLVYPCPLPNLVGLGVHSVVDMAGHLRFGPDATYVDDFEDVRVAQNPLDEQVFLDGQHAAVRRYVPSIQRERMFADFAGIRPKLAAAGDEFRDFLIEAIDGVRDGGASAGEPVMQPVTLGGVQASGNPTVVWVNGIESPGLTASSAIADLIASWLAGPEQRARKPALWSEE